MISTKPKTRIAGFLIILAMITGILSVSPAVDAENYLNEAAGVPDQVIFAAVFQFIMGLAYIGIAVLLYPVIRIFGQSLAAGFLSFRVIAATLVIFGSTLLPAILVLSQNYTIYSPQDPSVFTTLGDILKTVRDSINHVFMILVLCTGNLMFYILLFRSKLIPRWLSVWGMAAAALSAGASVLVLFRVFNIITPEYLVMNAPTALQELILAVWLMWKGFDNRVFAGNNTGSAVKV